MPGSGCHPYAPPPTRRALKLSAWGPGASPLHNPASPPGCPPGWHRSGARSSPKARQLGPGSPWARARPPGGCQGPRGHAGGRAPAPRLAGGRRAGAGTECGWGAAPQTPRATPAPPPGTRRRHFPPFFFYFPGQTFPGRSRAGVGVGWEGMLPSFLPETGTVSGQASAPSSPPGIPAAPPSTHSHPRCKQLASSVGRTGTFRGCKNWAPQPIPLARSLGKRGAHRSRRPVLPLLLGWAVSGRKELIID